MPSEAEQIPESGAPDLSQIAVTQGSLPADLTVLSLEELLSITLSGKDQEQSDEQESKAEFLLADFSDLSLSELMIESASGPAYIALPSLGAGAGSGLVQMVSLAALIAGNSNGGDSESQTEEEQVAQQGGSSQYKIPELISLAADASVAASFGISFAALQGDGGEPGEALREGERVGSGQVGQEIQVASSDDSFFVTALTGLGGSSAGDGASAGGGTSSGIGTSSGSGSTDGDTSTGGGGTSGGDTSGGSGSTDGGATGGGTSGGSGSTDGGGSSGGTSTGGSGSSGGGASGGGSTDSGTTGDGGTSGGGTSGGGGSTGGGSSSGDGSTGDSGSSDGGSSGGGTSGGGSTDDGGTTGGGDSSGGGGSANTAPVASDHAIALDEDQTATVSVMAYVTDPDADSLSVISVSQGVNGAVALNSDGTVTYTPAADFNGSDSFTYTVSDGNGGTDSATVTVTVNAINDAPLVVNQSMTLDEDTVATVSVLAGSSDAEGDILSVTSVSQGTNGTVAINSDGTVSYTPAADFNGIDSFTYTVSDGNGGTDSATVTVTVNPVADAPTAGDDAVNTASGTSTTVMVLSNDSSPDGLALTVASTSAAANGTVGINGGTSISYDPDAGFTGLDSFTYQVSDGNGGTDSATVYVYVGSSTQGGSGDDSIDGTPSDDVIFGNDGDDHINGRPGDDVLFGGAGDDFLDGNSHDDLLHGGEGSDILMGRSGHDTFIWDADDSVISGSSGTDTLRAENGDIDFASFTGSISGIDVIDLASDSAGNELTLTYPDVVAISDSNELVITGDGYDSLDAGTGWTDAGYDSDGNHVFTQGSGGSMATLTVDAAIELNTDITDVF